MIRDFDELRDIAIRMVDNLVEQGFIKDCTDEPDDSTEFDVQDLLMETLIDSLRQDECITPTGVVSTPTGFVLGEGNVELKEVNEDYEIAFISVDEIPLGIFTIFKDHEQDERPYVTIDYEVRYIDELI
jgi:hypothetical protein